jgi:Winged helix DNA-binding domain/GLTT repeat (6 copies)
VTGKGNGAAARDAVPRPVAARRDATQGIATQGIATQGIATQGIATQGIATQGVAAQGVAAQGVAAQGVAAQGVAAQGVAAQGVAAQGVAAQGVAAQGVAAQGVAAQGVAAQRFAAQLLSGRAARSPVEVAERLLAVQGQDPRGARLAIRARSTGLTAADVDKALTADRALLITWLNRGTLHLVRTEDYPLLQQLTVRPRYQQACLRHAAAGGVDAGKAERAVTVIAAALADGPLTRRQLGERIAAAGIGATGNAPLHLITLACLRGIAVRGPMVGAQHAYVLVRDWLGRIPEPLDHDVALAELARRYLAGHGPAADRDLAKWAGLPVGQARRGLAAIGPSLRERPDGLAELAASAAGGKTAELPAPRLLGSYDPVLLGWASREPILRGHQHIVTDNGLFRPFALVDGQAAGIWAWSAGEVTLHEFAGLPDQVKAALAAEARDVQRFLGSEPAEADDADPA